MTVIATVGALGSQQIKSCALTAHETIRVTPTGFPYDRGFIVVDERGVMVTQRKCRVGVNKEIRVEGIPGMCFIRTRVEKNELVLQAPNMRVLRAPIHGAVNQAFLTMVWGRPCMAQEFSREASSWINAYLTSKKCGGKSTYRLVKVVDSEDSLSFADRQPLLFISQASIDLLNQKIREDSTIEDKTPVSANVFRANGILTGCTAHAEDYFTHFTINGVRYVVKDWCDRCTMISINQATGRWDRRVTHILKTYQVFSGSSRILFGIYVWPLDVGEISVGDPLII